MKNLEKIKKAAIRDICSVSVTGAPKSKVREIVNTLVDIAYKAIWGALIAGLTIGYVIGFLIAWNF